MPKIQTLPSTYADDRVQPGIVHLGLGAFHRAHQAVYVEQCLARNNGGPWGIAAANLRSNKAIVESLEQAGYSYQVAEYASREEVTLREVRAIRKAFFAGDGAEALIAFMERPQTRIVTLTVTEKGYSVGADGRLLADDPAIKRDLERPESPRTPLGVIVRALERRMQAGLPPFTVLSCDNLPENGRRTRQAVLSFAALRNDALAAWIERNGAFPCSMVDRIVPAMTEASFAQVAGLLGRPDPNAVVTEDFIQWVVEDAFCQSRPDWEHDGVQMTGDVRPYERMKLRLLNGSHSLLAYVGGMSGRDTIVACMGDDLLADLVRHYLTTEAGPTLDVPEAVWKDAAARILRRFGNDSLAHKTNQIAMDGSQKIPQRWLSGTLEALAAGRACPCTALGLAGWLYHMREVDDAGQPFPMRDPLRDVLIADLHTDAAANADPDACVEALFARRDLIPEQLASTPAYVSQVKAMYRLMREQGALAAVKATLQA